jgi:hypothetical protein
MCHTKSFYFILFSIGNLRFDLAIEDVDQTKSHDTMLETCRGSSLRTFSPLEEETHSVLTPYAFKKFQEKFGRATQYFVFQENGNELCYNIIKTKLVKSTWYFGMVRWLLVIISILNFGVYSVITYLSVFLHKDCYKIPPIYLSSHWCCKASLHEKELVVLDDEN